jgi:hypothetical protein
VATAATVDVRGRLATSDKWFYVWMGGLCMLLPLGGFGGTYLAPTARGTFEEPTILHLHALLSFGWTSLFVVQSSLIAQRRVARHRTIGLAGISLATATFFTGVIVAIKAMDVGIAAGGGESARAFAIFPLTIIVMFAGLCAAGIANMTRPAHHKRLMLMATIQLMPPALIRLIGVAAGSQTMLGPRQFGVPPPSVSVGAGLAAGTVAGIASDLLIVGAMIYDWRTKGRPHRVYWIAGGIIVAVQVARIPMSSTGAWTGFTDVLSSLAR